jgi:hypothetical protein
MSARALLAGMFAAIWTRNATSLQPVATTNREYFDLHIDTVSVLSVSLEEITEALMKTHKDTATFLSLLGNP